MNKKLFYHQMLVSHRIGGAENLAIEIHKHVNRERADSSELLVPFGGSTQGLAESENLAHQSYRLDWLLRPERIPSLAANLDLYLKLFRSSRGLLHIHSPYVFGALRPFLTFSRLWTVLHLHLDYTEEQLGWAFKLHPDLVIVCAKFMEERVAQLISASRTRKARIMVAVNAVDTSCFFPGDRLQARQNFEIDLDRLVLLMVANLASHKGQETAIRATSILVERGYNPILWLVGEEREAGGEYAKHLRSLVVHLGLSDFVKFLGFRQDIPKLLHAVDFLLLPSIHEGLPLVILEAQASKVVVLAAPTAGIPEVVENGHTGFLIEADNPIGYAETMISLIKNIDLKKTIVEMAYRQIISNFSLRKYCESILLEYDKLINEK